jgi:ribose-phosphate pyrophosphokinase
MLLFAGSSHPALADSLARELGVELGKRTVKRFASGECYVKYDQSLRGQNVFILQAPGRSPDERLMELFMMCQAAKLSFAKAVHVILPHFSYARQDRVAEPREPISAKLIADLLQAAGADHVITLNLHSQQVQGFFSVPVDALESRDLFVEHFAALKLKDPIVVSPDVGGAKQAKKFADEMGSDLAILHKVRTAHHKADVKDVIGDVNGRTCILFDDMIDTGSSLMPAKEALLNGGANPDIYVAATHGVFSGPAIERLTEARFAQVVVTDSIPNDPKAFDGLTILPIAPLLAKVVDRVDKGTSVTEMYGKRK